MQIINLVFCITALMCMTLLVVPAALKRRCENKMPVCLKYPAFRTLIITTMITISLFPVAVSADSNTIYVDASGGGDFTTIQAAINAASAGSTIIVRDGTYTENIAVSKSVNITSENGTAAAILTASSASTDAISVTAADVTIRSLTVTGATGSGKYGILVKNVAGCNLSGNVVFGNNRGISLSNSTGATLTGNTMYNNTYDFYVSSQYAHNVDTTNLVGGKPIYYWFCEHNRVMPIDAGCVVAVNCTNITVKDLTITGQYFGVRFINTQNSQVENVTADKCYIGASVSGLGNNKIENCNLTYNEFGTYIYTSNNTIVSNNASYNKYGIAVASTDNTVSENIVNANTAYGIYLTGASRNMIRDNIVNDNIGRGIWVTSLSNNNLLVNNTVNRKAGIAVMSGTGNTLINNTANEHTDGSGVGYYITSNTTLINNTAERNTIGIYFYDSSVNCMVSGNTVKDNTNTGIYIYCRADNNVVEKNLVSGSTSGIYLMRLSNYNIIRENTIFNNQQGITIDWYNNWGTYYGPGNGHQVYLNSFINNSNNVANSRATTISWNATTPINYTYNGVAHTGYPGNYWSDYTGTDADGDGTGDTPYSIAGGDQDKAPLIGIWDKDEIGDYQTIASITVAPQTLDVSPGMNQQFTAVARNAAGVPRGAAFTWSSSNETVGTVTPTGFFTALTEGNTTVIASSEGVDGTAQVMVNVQTLASIDVSPLSANLAPGSTQQFTAMAKDHFGSAISGVSFNWSSDNETVGTVDANGLFTATGLGTATVTATYGTIIGTALVTVAQTDLIADSISVVSPVYGKPVAVNVTVRNAGPAKAMAFNVTLLANNTEAGRVIIPSLDVLESREVSITWIPSSDGSINLTAVVDPENAAGDINTLNNTLSKTVEVSPATIDLVADSISVDSPVQGKPVAVNVKVRNMGTVEAGTFNVTLLANSTEVGQASVSSLGVSESRTFSITWTPSSEGPVNLTAVVDPENVVGDINTLNNTVSKIVTCLSHDIDLSVSSISTFYPYNYNTVTATIKNGGTADSSAFKVNFTVDGNTTTIDVPGLAAGNSTAISVIDPVRRKYGNSVPILITLDSENVILETNETNNEYTAAATVKTNGNYYTSGRYYTGNDIETSVYKEGHIGVVYSTAGIGYYGAGTVTYTPAHLPIPANATILSARLYQSWTWYGYGSGDTLRFNGNPAQSPVALYFDGIDGMNGQAVFDVTPYFVPGVNNTAVLTLTSSANYGPLLVVVYEDESEPLRQIWVDEGSDSIYNADLISTDPYIAYAMFHNVTTANLFSAEVIAIVPSGDTVNPSHENVLKRILVNGKNASLEGTAGSDPVFLSYGVTGAVQDGTNEIGLPLQWAGDYFNLAVAILEVTKVTTSQADFTANATTGSAPFTVHFTDTSTGTPANWTWDFGDSGTSTEQNPTHTYTSEGTYTVKLTVSNSLGSDSEEKTGYITVGSAVLAPVAEFSADPTTGTAPLTVQFMDESTNTPTSWAWDFGDSTTSNEQNPSHTYETLGTYTVKLTASNYGGSNSTTKTDYITVTSGLPAPVANFTTDANSGQVPFTVHFTDTSTGSVSSWKWNFGDSGTSTEQNPVHTYVTEGIYNVDLTATGPGGRTTATLPLTVSAPLTSPSHDGGIPLTTVQNGTVSGGLWYDSYYAMETSAQKTFTLPTYSDIKWARLYVTVYDGHKENNYRGNVSIGIDANGDSTYEIQKNEIFNSSYSYPGEGGTGPVWLSDHMNRVTSDYLMWYDLTDAIVGQQVNVQAASTKIDSSFDGRVKAMTLVVAYDDGDSDQVYYWVNQGHDTVNPLDTEYTGLTSFGTSSLASGWSSANLTAIYLASVDGTYTFKGTTLASGIKSGPYYGSNTWDINSLLTAGQDSALAYNKQGENDYYKIPLAFMSVRYHSASPELPNAAFTADATTGTAPLTVNFTDQSTGTPTSWLWDFGDGFNATEQNVSHTFTSAGTYTVKLTVTNAGGNDSETKTDYIIVSTPETPDATNPVIDSAVLFPANTTTGSTINFSVNATDNVGVTEVTAGDTQLTKTEGIWQGSITAPSSVGNYSLEIQAKDAAGNTASTSVPYRVLLRTGGANIELIPKISNVAVGNTVSLNIKVKNLQRVDDTFKVKINVSELPASLRADLSWFNWTEKVVTLRAGQEVLVPIEVHVPDGTAAGRKYFRAKYNSETYSSLVGFDTGTLVIS